jgi:hypothetical protein
VRSAARPCAPLGYDLDVEADEEEDRFHCEEEEEEEGAEVPLPVKAVHFSNFIIQ